MRCLLVDGVMDGRGRTGPHIDIIKHNFKLVLLITDQLAISFMNLYSRIFGTQENLKSHLVWFVIRYSV